MTRDEAIARWRALPAAHRKALGVVTTYSAAGRAPVSFVRANRRVGAELVAAGLAKGESIGAPLNWVLTPRAVEMLEHQPWEDAS